MKLNKLNKLNFSTAMRCSKKMFLSIHMPEKAEVVPAILDPIEISDFKNAVRQLIAPGGVLYNLHEAKLHKRTKKSITYYNCPITTDSMETTIDILIKRHSSIDIINIIPSTTVTESYFYQTAFDVACMLEAGVEVHGIYIACINKEYIRNGKLSPSFVSLRDFSKSIHKMIPRIKKRISYFEQVNLSSTPPDREIDYNCFKPDKCEFRHYCFPELNKNSIFDIRSMRTTRKLGFYYRDVKTIDDLVHTNSKNFKVSETIQIKAIHENKTAINRMAICDWLSQFQNDNEICFFDLEIVSPIIPPFEGCSPFKKIPFQFSLHSYNTTQKLQRHFEFIGDSHDIKTVRIKFLNTLINSLGKCHPKSKIIVYNETFEKSILHDLANVFPHYKETINAICNRIVDLMEIFKSNWYYDPRFKNSYSLKTITKFLAPEADYSSLKIQKGDVVPVMFRKMIESDEIEKKQIRNDLLAYCKMDTYSMMLIYQNLIRISQTETIEV